MQERGEETNENLPFCKVVPLYATNMTKVTDLGYMFYGCSGLTGTIPDFTVMADQTTDKLTSMSRAFYGCTGLTGNVPDVSVMVKLGVNNSLGYTFQNCSGLTGSVPAFPTNVAVYAYTYDGCSGLTGTIPPFTLKTNYSYNNLPGVFRGCTGLTGSIPDMTSIPLTSSIENLFGGCVGLSGSMPSFTTMTNLTNISGAFAGCTGLVGNVDVMFSDPLCMTLLYKSTLCFSNCVGLTGNGMTFVNLAKGPSYTVGTSTTDGSYGTFRGCTNLTDWAVIPAAYK